MLVTMMQTEEAAVVVGVPKEITSVVVVDNKTLKTMKK